jgi:hypothetical protein
MKKHLFGMALLTCLVMISGTAMAQTIDDIQYYDPITGAPLPGQEPPPGYNTDLSGALVTVTGVVVEKGQYSSASAHIQGATGGISVFYGSGTFNANLGDEVELTGTVGLFRDQIQIGGATSATVLTTGNTVVPQILTVGQVVSDYENVGWLSSVIGTVSEVTASNFSVYDGTDTVLVYIDSTTGIDISAVDVGDVYEITSPITIDFGLIELKPRFQGDLVENPGGDTLPVISNVENSNWTPLANQSFTISATIVDDIGVSSATLYYRDSDSVTPGAWSSVPMSNTGGNVFAGTVPGGHTDSQVDYYIEAVDTGAQTVTLPGAAPTVFLSVAVGFTPIYEVQYAHPDSSSQSAAFNGRFVNIQGVVTAGTSQVGSPTKFIVQEPDVNPATGDHSFSGILVYETTAAAEYFQGDLVAIGGEIDEFFGLTEMLPHNGNAVYLLDFGQDLPGPARVNTRTLADDSTADIDGDGIMGEAWESVWVQTFPAAVLDTLGFGEYILSDTGARPDSLKVDPLTQLTYEPIIGDVLKITSYMDYSFGVREIIPIADEFIIQTGASAVDDTPTIVSAGGFRSLAPNPFNPKTTIKFVVNRESLTQLNIYNIRGQKVRTVVQDVLVGEQVFVWDGTTDSGQAVASGAYFARLRIGNELVQVKQMTLLK